MRNVAGWLAAAWLAIFPGAALPQSDWPSRPVRMVVPYPPGGVTDIVSRALADKLTQALRQPIVVDNRAGAATTVASNFAAKAAPDGYTIYAASTSLVINPALQGQVQYDAKKDFVPVSLLAVTPFLLQVNAGFPARDMKELLAEVKANPDKYNMASSGVGAVNHLAAELFRSSAGLKIGLVPYKGGAQAGQDVAGGRAEMMFSAVIEALPHLQSGRTRAIAISSGRRLETFPDLPTVEQAAALGGFEAIFWQAMVVPAGTPKPIIERLHAALASIGADRDLKERFAKQGVDIRTSTPEELGALMEREEKRWSTLIRTRGIRAE
jgi:tripartite-type tricarboxylate transporter receptor subunit TctC